MLGIIEVVEQRGHQGKEYRPIDNTRNGRGSAKTCPCLLFFSVPFESLAIKDQLMWWEFSNFLAFIKGVSCQRGMDGWTLMGGLDVRSTGELMLCCAEGKEVEVLLLVLEYAR